MTLKPRGASVERCRLVAVQLRELAERLSLTVPILTLDLELTGTLREYDRICEIAAVMVRPGGAVKLLTSLINPLMPISPEASDKNKITDAMVADAPQWGEVGGLLRPGIVGDIVLFGFNMRGLDIPVLEREYSRVGMPLDFSSKKLIDPFVIAQQKEGRDLSALYAFYCGKKLEDAHEAAADLGPPIEIFGRQLSCYSDLARMGVAQLAELCSRRKPEYVDRAGKFIWRGGRIMIAFGQRTGQYVDEIDHGWLTFVLNGTFEEETKEVCRRELRRRNGPQQGSLLTGGGDSSPF